MRAGFEAAIRDADPDGARVRALLADTDDLDVVAARQILTALLDPLGDRQAPPRSVDVQLRDDATLGEPVSVALFHTPGTYWTLGLVRPLRADRALAEAVITDALVWIAVPMVLLVGIYWLLLRHVVLHPLHHITRHMSADEPGTLHLNPGQSDELAQLVRSYNSRTDEMLAAHAQLSRINDDLTFQANHDSLTGLHNRRSFERYLDDLIATGRWNDSALMMMDIDQFKVINDTAGHLVGDRLLVRVGSELRKQMREGDFVARLGGDEFAVVVTSAEPDDAAAFARRLCDGLAMQHFSAEEHLFNITVSLGLLPLAYVNEDPGEAMRLADNACFAAKDAGRNRVHVVQPDDTQLAKREGEMHWVSQLREALNEDRFVIHFQPIEPLRAGERPGVEVLVRLCMKDGEIVPPGAFLPAAQRYGIINLIDLRVLEMALSNMAEHPELFDAFGYVSVNLSQGLLSQDEFAELVTARIDRWRVDPAKLCFEVTETAVIQHREEAGRQLARLREIGSKVALDDFGSGMSSYGYLRDLPVDILKIDGAFVRNMENDAILQVFVRSMGDIARAMGLGTVAEFVENPVVCALLGEFGIDYAQGYGVARPGDLESLATYLAERSDGCACRTA